jgi:hypothetical protein
MSWGDIFINYHTTDSMFTGEWIWKPTELEYPPLTLYLLIIFKFLSFGIFEIFVFYDFLLELLISLSFYFVLSRFKISQKFFVLGLFLVNPFVFLNNVFSLESCGYHITDSFFYFFLFLSVYYYKREDKSLFYFFSGLTMCTKWFTLPAALYFILKFILERNWKELKKLLLFMGIPISIFLISPIFYLPDYLSLYLGWISGRKGIYPIISDIPLIVKLVIFIGVFLLILFFRIKKADLLELTFLSIIVMFSIMFFSRPYVRYLTPLIIYGHLKTKENLIKIDLDLRFTDLKITLGNNFITYFLSILGCLLSILSIIFILQ